MTDGQQPDAASKPRWDAAIRVAQQGRGPLLRLAAGGDPDAAELLGLLDRDDAYVHMWRGFAVHGPAFVLEVMAALHGADDDRIDRALAAEIASWAYRDRAGTDDELAEEAASRLQWMVECIFGYTLCLDADRASQAMRERLRELRAGRSLSPRPTYDQIARGRDEREAAVGLALDARRGLSRP